MGAIHHAVGIPPESRALPANLCPISRSIPTDLWRIATDHFMHQSRQEIKPKV
jgi:hypothetical protein